MRTNTSQKAGRAPGRHSSKSILVLGIVVLLIAAAGLAFWAHRASNKPHNGPTKQQLAQEAKQNSETKKQAIEHPTQGQPAPAPDQANFVITASKGPGGTETITAALGAVADGTCTLDITNGDKHTSQTADVIYQPQSSSCAGFSVPISDLGTGSWRITLSVASNGTTTSKTVTQVVQ